MKKTYHLHALDTETHRHTQFKPSMFIENKERKKVRKTSS